MRVRKWLPLMTAPEVELKADRIQTAAIHGFRIVRNERTAVGDERLSRLCDQCDRHNINGVLDRDTICIADHSRVRAVQQEQLAIGSNADPMRRVRRIATPEAEFIGARREIGGRSMRIRWSG